MRKRELEKLLLKAVAEALEIELPEEARRAPGRAAEPMDEARAAA